MLSMLSAFCHMWLWRLNHARSCGKASIESMITLDVNARTSAAKIGAACSPFRCVVIMDTLYVWTYTAQAALLANMWVRIDGSTVDRNCFGSPKKSRAHPLASSSLVALSSAAVAFGS